MHQRRRAVGALCALVVLLTAACAGNAAQTAAASTSETSSGPSGAGSGAVLADDQNWQLSPSWALHPELLKGSERFQELARKRRPTPGERPNIVLISTDDQTAAEMRWMPKTRALLGGGAGTRFSDSLSPHPLCCPARAMMLTGQFAQNNGVRSNFWPYGGYYKVDSNNTLPVWLKQAGYQTAFLGKYLNEYGLLNPAEVPPGWDHWRAPVKSGIYDYFNYTMNEDGELEPSDGTYQTDYYASETENVISQMAARDKPFFIWQSNLAPHSACPTSTSITGSGCWESVTPSTTYDHVFDDVPLPQRRDPSFNERDVSDKPQVISKLGPLGPARQAHLNELFQRRIESLQSVDDSVARTVAALDEAGELDDTLILFTSDNGYLLGQHRYQSKILGYEESLRVPLLMRGPSVPAGVRRSATVGTVDLAPTIMSAAGAKPGLRVDGRDLLPVAAGQAPGWDTILIQGGPRKPNSGDQWLYRGVRTQRYTYMEYPRTSEVELYDRQRDPYQLENAAGDPVYREVQSELQRRLRRLEVCAGADCRRSFGAMPKPERR
ncbi:MAG: sulfatase family protein [Nocardioidaceae bacterium]